MDAIVELAKLQEKRARAASRVSDLEAQWRQAAGRDLNTLRRSVVCLVSLMSAVLAAVASPRTVLGTTKTKEGNVQVTLRALGHARLEPHS